ncbi:23 kDa jasmonate-induced protein-like [Ziziphus jujuba]|uniref:23 kDa jasmonate-induced protein-like n=1 Tax=Ziziphus jujuba TaxID=326968 RepID=A0ABM4ACS3_ZIZJJ|nr:23 kDa jasmonate-induced protein-like [Ziziphus jujuba]
MGSNVFGNPITTKTLEQMPEYIGKKITRTDRAHVAMNMKNAEGKDVKAREFVEDLKEKWGNGVSTLCVIYNATGDTIRHVGSNDWYGHIGDSPYPSEIANGQWGAFLHVKTSGASSGSVAATVYRGLNEAGQVCDWMLSWYNPWSRLFDDNQAYTEIREGHHYEEDHWDYIYNILKNKGLSYTDNWNGCISSVSTGSSTSPIFEGVMKLVGA